MSRIHLERPPRNDDELYELVKSLWGVCIPRNKVCVDHNAPFEAFSTAFFAREPQILIHGSRGLAGKSVLMSTLGQTCAVVWGSDCNILGGSMSQSENVLQSMLRNWDSPNAPSYMMVTPNRTEHLLSNKARIRPLTASQKTVRGPHPARLLLDEIDEMDEMIFQAALGQPMPQKNWMGVSIPAQTTMASTWQYPDGVMTKQMARFREENLPIMTWCFRESANPIDGWLSPEFIEQKKREIPKEMWRVEYELGEPSIGNRAVDHESVERMFDVNAPEPMKMSREHQEYHVLPYSTTRDYVVAADWAKEQDWTVIGVWDVTELPIRLAYYVRMKRRPYPFMVGYFNQLQKRYHAEGIHDGTGLGGVISDYMDSRVHNFIMSGAVRDNMLSEWVSAVENDRIRSSRIDSFYTSVKYLSVDQLYSRSKEFHLPDEVCSAALAWHMVANRYPTVMPFAGKKTDENWMSKAVIENTPSEYGQMHQGVVREQDAPDVLSFT